MKENLVQNSRLQVVLSWFCSMFSAFIHDFVGVAVGVAVINISYLMPAAVLVCESWLLM